MEEQITSFLYNHSDTGLVVIDTLQKVRSCDQSGSMYASDYKDVSALKSLAAKYGICILLIHHLRKQAASDPFDQISGSNGLMGAADTTWVMQRKRTSKNADIILTGRDLDRRTLYLHAFSSDYLQFKRFGRQAFCFHRDRNLSGGIAAADHGQCLAVVGRVGIGEKVFPHVRTCRTKGQQRPGTVKYPQKIW